MKLFNIFKKQETKSITKELISLNSLANVPTKDYFKDNNQVLLLINLYKKEYLEILIKEKVLTSKELKSNKLQNELKMIHNLIEQNTLADELFEKVFFNEEDKVKALIKLRKFAIYNEKIITLEEEIVSRIIALKEILKKTFLNKQKRASIINEVNNLTNTFVILMNQKEILKLCLNNYGLKCFDILKEKDKVKEEELIKARKKELNEYQKQAFGKIVYKLNDLNDMAKVEVALEEYVYNYKRQYTSLWKKIKIFCYSLEKELNTQRIDFNKVYKKILELENRCNIFYEFGQNIIDKEDFKKFYLLKFKLIIKQFESNKTLLINPFVNEKTSKLELETYEEIIFKLINTLSDEKTGINTIYKTFTDKSFKLINLLKKELQVNGKYDALDILKDKYKLNLLIAFSNHKTISKIMEIYKLIYVKKSDYTEINFYEPDFIWDEYLPLETINELKIMQNQTKDLDLYLFLKKYYSNNFKEIYYLPEGLKKVGYLKESYSGDTKTPEEMKEINKFVEKFRQNMIGKTVVFPKSLKYVWGDLIGGTELKALRLNDELECFNFNFTPTANVEKMTIPSSVLPFNYGYHMQLRSKLKEVYFLDFKKSCFYNNIENLKSVLGPHIKIKRDKWCEAFNYELTIDRIIILDDSYPNYPNKIILEKEECQMTISDFRETDWKYQVIKHINDLILEKIAEYPRNYYTKKLFGRN